MQRPRADCRLVSRPRINLTHFHGVFAPNSKHRVQVTPTKRGKQPEKAESADDDCLDKSPEERHQAMTWMQRLKRLFNIDVVVARSKWSGQAICDNPVKQLFSFQRCLIRSHKDNNSPGASAIVGYCKTSIYSPIYPVELHIWSAPVLGEPVSVLGKEKLQSSIRLLVGFVSPGSSWKSAHSRPYHLDGLPMAAADGTHRFPGIQALPFVPLPSFLTYQQRG